MKNEMPQKQEIVKCEAYEEAGARTGAIARLTGSELLMDAVSCIPLSAGILAALLTATRLDGSMVKCLAACAVSVAVVTALSRRWWLFPAVLAAFAAVWFPVSLLTGVFAENMLYWREFAGWVISGAPHMPSAVDAGFTTTIFFMAAVSVTLPVFVMLRRFFCFPVFVALQASAVILAAILKAPDLSAAVCLGLAGLIMLLPRLYAGHIGKMGGPDSRTVLSRANMQAVAIPAALLSVLFALWVTPAETHNWKSNLLSSWAGDIGTLITGKYREPQMSAASFHLSAIGYGTDTGRLGGPVTLDDKLYLIVRAPRPVLLKGSVLDYYDGAGWRASRPDGSLRFNSLLWLGEKNGTFDLDKPVGTAMAKKLFGQLTDEMSISVIHEEPAFGSLFTAGNVRAISLGDRLRGFSAYFNKRSDVFARAYIPSRAEYTMRTRIWNTHLSDFDELFTQLEEQASDQDRYAEVSERYTQLPEDLPGEVRAVAALITSGIESPYMKASAVSRWLAENNEYTLNPEIPPEGVDFTAYFLESREGYCVYYATAMTVLARCCGLPARYVQGLALVKTPWDSNYRYQATGLTAHAWSEVYFEGIGWLHFDPLSWDTEAPLNETSGEDEARETAPTPHTPTPAQEAPPEREPQQEARSGLNENTMLALLISCLFALALSSLYWLALRVGPRHMAKAWTRDAMHRRFADPSKQLDALYNDTLKLLALHGLTVRADETLATFPQRIDRIVALEGVKLAEMASAMTNAHFAGLPPSDGDILRACLYHSELEALTLEALGKRKYLFKRLLKA